MSDEIIPNDIYSFWGLDRSGSWGFENAESCLIEVVGGMGRGVSMALKDVHEICGLNSSLTSVD